jgi:regulatory protein
MCGRTSVLEWSVVLPKREAQRSTLGSKKPLATVLYSSCGGLEEERLVPLSVGKVLSSKYEAGEVNPESLDELLRIIGALEESSCRNRVESLLNRRDYSEREIRDRLLSDGYSRSVVDGVVGRFVESGLVSDARYGELFVRSKVNAGWGQRKIEVELSRRGIEASDVPGWPYEYFDPDDEFERALGIASARRFSGKDPYAKVVRFLAGRGFPLSVARDVASRLAEDES